MATTFAERLILSEEEISKIIAFEEEDSSGNDCRFIDMKNGWGIKCYEENVRRNISFTCQKEAAKLDFAPIAGKKFSLIDQLMGDKWFCFVTEVVKPIAGYGMDNQHAFRPKLMYEERQEFCENFWVKTGIEYEDDCAGNFGLKDKKLVAIDWDKCYNWYTHLTGKEIKWTN